MPLADAVESAECRNKIRCIKFYKIPKAALSILDGDRP